VLGDESCSSCRETASEVALVFNIVLPYSEVTTKINAVGDPSLRHTKLRQQHDKNPSYGTVSIASSFQFAAVSRHVRRGLLSALFSDDGGSTHL
jgi:hypothetical protein